MRPIGLLTVVTGMLVLASSCSDGAGTPPPDNTAPVANFTVPPCTIHQPCDFASTSTDDVQVTEWSWDFNGDGTPDANTAAASFTYATAETFNVSLTVHDAEGLTHTKTSSITIAPVENAAPVANFAVPQCTVNQPCDFASTSTDDVQVTEWSWDFNGDGTPDANTATASFTYATATTFNVSLAVRDAPGLSNTKTSAITVAAAPVNTPPTASFTYRCSDGSCTFTSTSTDPAPGTIVTYAWTFGNGATANVMNPLYRYAITAPMEVTVTLTVTDNEGATDVESQTFMVSPPPPVAEGCTTTNKIVDCAFNVTARSTMKVKLLGVDCDRTLEGTRVVTPPPISDMVFLHVCWRTAGEEIGIFGGPLDELIVYEAGSQVLIRFLQGTPDEANHPPVGLAGGRFEGTFPDWTLYFEDGSNPGGAGEPDFNDVVVGLHATVVP